MCVIFRFVFILLVQTLFLILKIGEKLPWRQGGIVNFHSCTSFFKIYLGEVCDTGLMNFLSNFSNYIQSSQLDKEKYELLLEFLIPAIIIYQVICRYKLIYIIKCAIIISI